MNEPLLTIDVTCILSSQDASASTIRLTKMDDKVVPLPNGNALADFVANIISSDNKLCKVFDADGKTKYQLTITKLK